MTILYSNSNNRSRVREPLFQVGRTKYKSSRVSQFENLETNLLKLDIQRIFNEFSSIDVSVLDKLEFIVSGNFGLDNSTKLNDGVSKTIDNIQFFYDKENSSVENLELDSINKMSGTLVRLINKIKRLELNK